MFRESASGIVTGFKGRGVNKEGANGFGNKDFGEELGPKAVVASRWAVGWVELTWNVLCVDFKAAREGANKLMDSLETLVGFVVAVTTVPPPFDDPCIVAVENDALANIRDSGDGVDE